MEQPILKTVLLLSRDFQWQQLRWQSRLAAWVSLVLVAVVAFHASAYMALATLAYCSMVLGLFERKRPSLHIPMMGTAVLIDIAIVLVLELSRSAVGTALYDELNVWQISHIVSSLMTILLYIPAVALGMLRASGRLSPKWQRGHRHLGVLCFFLRSLGWLTMFSLLNFGS